MAKEERIYTNDELIATQIRVAEKATISLETSESTHDFVTITDVSNSTHGQVIATLDTDEQIIIRENSAYINGLVITKVTVHNV